MKDPSISKAENKNTLRETHYGAMEDNAPPIEASVEEEAADATRSHRVRTAMIVGMSSLAAGIGLLGLRQKNNKQVRKQIKKLQKNTRKNLRSFQGSALDRWGKTQDALSSSVNTAQDMLARNARQAQKNMQKTQKNFQRMQGTVQENVAFGLTKTQSMLSRGTRQASQNLQNAAVSARNITQRATTGARKMTQNVATSAMGIKENTQDRYGRYVHRQQSSRRLFRWGLAVGIVLALFYAPIAGSEIRQRLARQWQEYRSYFGS